MIPETIIGANDLVVCLNVKVDRSRSPQEMLNSTGIHHQFIDPKKVNLIPRGEGAEVDLYFFKIAKSKSIWGISHGEVEKEYERRGLKADPYAQISLNLINRDFLWGYQNVSCWYSSDQEIWPCFLVFGFFIGGRYLSVGTMDTKWQENH